MTEFNSFEEWFEENFNIKHPKEDYVISFEYWKEDVNLAWNEGLLQALTQIEKLAREKQNISVLDATHIIESLMD